MANPQIHKHETQKKFRYRNVRYEAPFYNSHEGNQQWSTSRSHPGACWLAPSMVATLGSILGSTLIEASLFSNGLGTQQQSTKG
uniref:Uncharacterized protein n=1 Tax=Aegilops tauschii subsp. strangulata TaxID=200361 RepID=A0A453HFQ1_AEGTS